MENPMLDPVDPQTLDRFTQLAAQVLEVPAVRVSIIDGRRRTVVGCYGRAWSAGRGRAGNHVDVPLVTADGRRVGTLTVMGRNRRTWTTQQRAFLQELSLRLVSQVDIGPVDQVM